MASSAVLNCKKQPSVICHAYRVGDLYYIYILNSISMITPLGSKRSPDVSTENSAEEELSVCPGKEHLRVL